MFQEEPNKSNVPDPEVVPRAKRTRFSAAYKLRILEEVDACTELGQIGPCCVGKGCTHHT